MSALHASLPGTWVADLCAHEGIAFVLGHALSMQTIHGGKATNGAIDAHTMAVRLRGGMLPQASGSPAELRATRDLVRRRMSRTRQRAERLTPVQNPNRQDQPARARAKARLHGEPRRRRCARG